MEEKVVNQSSGTISNQLFTAHVRRVLCKGFSGPQHTRRVRQVKKDFPVNVGWMSFPKARLTEGMMMNSVQSEYRVVASESCWLVCTVAFIPSDDIHS